MKSLSLCSGIGGIDLACEWAGIETVAFCECETFPQKVLRKHWPNVPINEDIFTMNRRWLEQNGIDPGTIGLVHAGYPCQGESYAGDREGEEDERWLWPETARTLEEITPDWFVGENVSGHITMGLDTVLTDLGNLGYTAQPFHIPALAVDGDHERYRIFIVAYSDKKPGSQTYKAARALRESRDTWENARRSSWRPVPRTDWSVSGPPVSRESDGIPDRMDRCFALGNAVNPYQIYPILAAIKQIDEMIKAS